MKSGAETKERIIDTFLAQYAKKPFELITVKGITEELAINRGTFYLHFLDLDELLTTLEDEHLAAIQKLNKENRHHYLSRNIDEMKSFYIPTLEYIGKNRNVINVLMGIHSRSRFRESLASLMRSNVKNKYESAVANYKWDEYKKYIIDIIVAGNISIIRNWVSTDSKNSAEDIAELFIDIIKNLPYMRLEG